MLILFIEKMFYITEKYPLYLPLPFRKGKIKGVGKIEKNA